MALIAGFPVFAGSADLASALNLALTKIVEQIGGVDGDGVYHPGNLDLTNHVAFPGFAAAQRERRRSIVMLAYGSNENESDAGPLSFDATLVGFGIGSVTRLDNTVGWSDLAVTLKLNGIEAASFASWHRPNINPPVGKQWRTNLAIPAGTRITLALTSDRPPPMYTALLYLKANHRR